MIVNFVGINFSWILLSFVSMIIFKVLGILFKVYYLQHLIVDIRISSCSYGAMSALTKAVW